MHRARPAIFTSAARVPHFIPRLFSRHAGGEFVLRIEDTDLERSTRDAIDAIMDGMNWLNTDWDEGPYFQTKRFDRYNAVIDEMLEQGGL